MPRPKRFGKTLNLSMIEHFFDIQIPESTQLFTGFKISEKRSFVRNIENKSLKVYLWNPDTIPAYFDDFRIEKFVE